MARSAGQSEGRSTPTEAAAFDGWYASHFGRVYNTMVAVTHDMAAAEDATQEAFARALANWRRVRAMANPVGWVYRVALNDVRRSRRRQALERRIVRQQEPDDLSPSSLLDVWQVIDCLPPRQRTAVALRHIAGLTEQEIAESMRIKRGTVSRTLGDAYDTLRRNITDDDQ